MRNLIRKTIFRIKWLLMSERSRYNYLGKRAEERE
jgi:hypothetical protein